jgi:peptidoglycan/xylan/chitin deacetylase (PgdA/CDA1 family)
MVRLDRFASLFVTRPLLDAGLLRAKYAIPILMYHSISDDPEPGVPAYYRLATSPARFREQMQWLKDQSFTVIDLMEALRRLETGANDVQRTVVLTFDDGFRDFLHQAWPVLSEFGFSGTVFLPTAYIGQLSKPFKGRQCMTWEEVRAMRDSGIRVGAHTVNHSILYRLPWNELRRELHDCREQIEHELQQPVRAFAYPYAFPQEDRPFVERLRNELHGAGYRSAVTTVIGRATEASDPLCLERLPINDCDDAALFASKLAGAYDWVGGCQAAFRRTKRRLMTTRPA